ncbi:MAG: phosphotransferase, partial [Dehalococcoidia bacterium]
MTPEELSARLAAFLKRSHDARAVQIDDLRMLTGGASRQTWSFDARIEGEDGSARTLPLVLRSNPRSGTSAVHGELEYRLLNAAHQEGVPVPKPHLLGDDSLDAPFFLMERVEGETIPRRLLRDDVYANARASMAAQLGGILARIHRIDIVRHKLEALPSPPSGASPAEDE